jgi:hypothetical protein
VLVGEADRLAIAAAIRVNRPLPNKRAAGRGHDREYVLISVPVHADHVIHLLRASRPILHSLVGSTTPV